MKYVGVAVLTVLSLWSLPSGRDKRSLAASEIISKHLSAVGGTEALAKLKTRVAVGTVKKENEVAAELAIFSELPNRLSANYRFEKYDWRLRYGGSKPIFFPPISRKLYVITDKYNEMLASGLMFNDIALSSVLTEDNPNPMQLPAKPMPNLHPPPPYPPPPHPAHPQPLPPSSHPHTPPSLHPPPRPPHHPNP